MATVKVEGLDALRRKLAAMSTEVRASVQASLNKSGEEMAQLARALAPVDTGNLRDSIVVTKAGESTPLYASGGRQKVGDLQVMVTAGDFFTRYVGHVEYGTDKMAARPFFGPAYRVLKKRTKSRTSRDVNKAIKKAIR